MRGRLIQHPQEGLYVALGAVQKIEQAVRSFDSRIEPALRLHACGRGCRPRTLLLCGFLCCSLGSGLHSTLLLQPLGLVTCGSCGTLLFCSARELGVTLCL